MHALRIGFGVALLMVSLVPLGGRPVQALSLSPTPVDIPDSFPENGFVARVVSLGSVIGLPVDGIVPSGSVASTDTTLLRPSSPQPRR